MSKRRRGAQMVNTLLDQLTGVTLEQVAEWAGVSVYTVREWRLGRRQPSAAVVQRLAEAGRRHADRIAQVVAQLERHAQRRSA